MSKLSWMCAVDDCENPKLTGLGVCASHAAVARKEKRQASKPVAKAAPLRRVPVQRYSEKQVDIVSKLHELYEMMDAQGREEQGGILHCSAYPNHVGLNENTGPVDHSHTISQDRCKKLGHPEWIYAEWNIEYSSRIAHEEWDHYKPEFLNHANFSSRMAILKQYDPHDYDRRMEIWAAHNQPKATV